MEVITIQQCFVTFKIYLVLSGFFLEKFSPTRASVTFANASRNIANKTANSRINALAANTSLSK